MAFRGSPDGLTVCDFTEGEIISPSDPRLSESLWGIARAEGWIEERHVKTPAPANKADAPTQNKALEPEALGGGWYLLPDGRKVRGKPD